jgi:hypothetical protein
MPERAERALAMARASQHQYWLDSNIQSPGTKWRYVTYQPDNLQCVSIMYNECVREFKYKHDYIFMYIFICCYIADEKILPSSVNI